MCQLELHLNSKVLLFLLFLTFYYLYPLLAYLIKTFFLHRRHALHNWMTQYAGMNAFGLLLLSAAFVISLIAPILMAIPVLLLFLVHLSSYLVTFIASLYQTINETKPLPRRHQRSFAAGDDVRLLAVSENVGSQNDASAPKQNNCCPPWTGGQQLFLHI